MKRLRTDSNTMKTQRFQMAATTIEPPEHCPLTEAEFPFWRSIVRARATDLWNTADLELAASLARCKAHIERLTVELSQQGDVIETPHGPVVNPLHKLLETNMRRAVALSRLLKVHAEATIGKSRDLVKANTQQRGFEKQLEEMDDELISKPLPN